ncbi:cytochrome P450 [Cadophora sp. DSE1049]|nr:cytochrome P450 [Cadophora sp. DSE1049]
MPANSSSVDGSIGLGVSNTYTLFFATVLATAIFIRWYTSNASVDPREPPLFRPKVPFIGHLLGIIQLQADYLQKLCEKVQKPIFTLKIFSARIYIITSPDLVQAVYRNAKTLSFDPISTSASKRVFQMTDRQINLLRGSAPGVENGEEFPVAKATYKIMHATMQPGASLFQMNARALNKFASFLDDIGTQGQEVSLYEWSKRRFTIATAEALYGPINPISEDESMIQKLIDFESSVGLLFLDLLPSITCPAGHHARSAFTAAFKRYYDGQHNINASAIIQGRFSVLSAGGMTTDDIATFDIGILMGATMNSNPGLFWLISYIYTIPNLLSSIRSELSPITTLTTLEDGIREATLNISLLHQKCPLLISAWQETLRVKTATVANRIVLEDTLLNSTYLLKKGSVIQMPCNPMHTSPSNWGSSASNFSPTRFLPTSVESLNKDDKKKRKQAFTPFGGGTVLCPGRYFATSEIVGVAAMLALGFEIEGARMLDVKLQVMSAQVKHPGGDLPVRIRRREGWEGVKFKFASGDGDVEEDLVFG